MSDSYDEEEKRIVIRDLTNALNNMRQRAEAAEAEGARLRAQIRALPSPLSWHTVNFGEVDSDETPHWHCAWCGRQTAGGPLDQSVAQHAIGCLWATAHRGQREGQ